jgi:Carboxypeptidase regulatory-like domain/TonB-dependent Receptor Plug Domain
MRRYYVALCVVVLLACANIASGQSQTGQIFGEVTDATGAGIPKVKVTITSTSVLQPLTTATSDTGSYRFADIPIGTYTVKFEAENYRTYVRENVEITIGFNAEINAPLKLASVSQRVEVSGAAPVIDVQSTAETAELGQERLQQLPTARGVYNIAEQSPGVQSPAKDVGGSTNGSQIYMVSRGADGNQTRYYLDGVDLSPAGSYTGFWVDYDTIVQAETTNGGADPEVQTSGMAINMVTKSGSDTFHGSLRYYLEDQRFEANNLGTALRQAVSLPGTSAGNPLQHFSEFGGDIGGPLKKGRLWFWASYGQQAITVGDDKLYQTTGICPTVAADPLAYSWGTVRACTQSDVSTLRHLSYKIGWQVFHNNTFTFENIYGTKEEPHFLFGPTTAIESTINLSENYNSHSRGPRFWDAGWTPLWRFDDQQIINDRWVLDVSFVHFGKQNTFGPQTPDLQNVQVQRDLSTGQTRASGLIAYQWLSEPMNSLQASSSYFVPKKWGGSHTLKFGYLWSRYENWGEGFEGGGAMAIFNETTPGAQPFTQSLAVNFYRPSIGDAFLYHQAGWFLDTYRHNRLSLNLGIRWDRQRDMELAQSIPASMYEGQIMADGVTPFNWLPAVQYPGANGRVVWNTFAPRIGAAYDLFGNGKTVLKASYAQYYDMRTAGELAGTFDTVGVPNGNGAPSLSYVQFPWTDLNGDGIVQMNEVGTTYRTFGNNYNPANPAGTTSPNSVDPNVKDPRTDEVTVGVGQELAPGFALTVTYVYRRYSDFIWDRLDGITSADFAANTYTPASCPTRTYPVAPTDCATVTYYSPTVHLPSAYTVTNQPDYYRTYHGLEISLEKRMSKNWMLSGSFTAQSTRQFWSSPDAYQDPTNIAVQNGAQYAPTISAASGYPVNVGLNARWISRFGGRYVLPWHGIGIAASDDFRQGYPIESTINISSRPNGAASIAVLISPPGTQRFKNLQDLDIRIDKTFVFSERLRLEPSLDIYNLFNANTILGQQPNQNASNANYIGYVLSPRIARFGIRFSF